MSAHRTTSLLLTVSRIAIILLMALALLVRPALTAQAAVTTYPNNTPVAIPDNNSAGITSTIIIPVHTSAYPLAVGINITHTYDGDLSGTLTSPKGTTVMLFYEPGGFGDNIVTTLDDSSPNGSIQTGIPPFTGSYVPYQSLSSFNDQDAYGMWTLKIVDNAVGDTGTLNSWSLILDSARYVTLVESNGSTTVTEGGVGDSYALQLINPPTDIVAVTPQSDSKCTVSPATLTFTSTNYAQPQNVFVEAVNDSIDEGPHTCIIGGKTSSNDPNFNGAVVPELTVNVIDNDANQPALLPPQTLLPVDRSNISTQTPKFTWKAVTGASQYHLQIDSSPSFSAPLERYTGSTLSYSAQLVDGLTFGQVYYWRVQGGSALGNWSDWSAVRRFTLAIMKAPADGSFTTSAAIPFSWYSVPGAQSYTLYVTDENNGFMTNVYTGPLLKFTVNTTKSMRRQWYLCVVLASGQNQCSISYPWKVTNIPALPPAPELIGPADKLLTTNANPPFSWNPLSDDADGHHYTYQIQIDTLNSFAHPKFDTTASSTTFNPVFMPDGVYFWRVRAINYWSLAGKWTSTRQITIDNIPPPDPLRISPPDYAIVTTLTPTFKWAASPGAVAYALILDGNYFPQVKSTSFSLPSTSALADHSFHNWRVQAYGPAGNSNTPASGANLYVESDMHPLPNKPVLDKPDANLTTNTTPSFSWIIGGNPTPLWGVQFQIDTSSKFPHPLASNAILGAAQTSITLGSSLSDGRYFWRVRFIDSDYVAGPWSEVRTLTIDSVRPAYPVLSAPADSAFMTTLTPKFSWKKVTGAVGYHISIYKPGTFNQYDVPGTSFVSPALDYGLWQWYVNARDAAANSSFDSAHPNFYVTIQSSPAPAAILSAAMPTFKWAPYPGATSSTKYTLTITNEVGGSSIAPQDVYGTSYTPATPLSPGQYSWIIAVDGKTMPKWYFSITSQVPPAPTLVLPADKAMINTNLPTLRWNSVAYADRYEVSLTCGDDIEGGNLTVLYFVPDSPPDGLCTWKVRAINSAKAAGKWSAARSFTIDTVAPAAPVLISPAPNDSISNTKLVLTWTAVSGAAGYELELDTDSNFPLPPTVLGPVTSYKVPAPLSETSYWWRVRAFDAAGNKLDWTDSAILKHTFTVISGMSVKPTPVPTPIEPTNEPSLTPNPEEPTIEPSATPSPAPAEPTAMDPTVEASPTPVPAEPTVEPTQTEAPAEPSSTPEPPATPGS